MPVPGIAIALGLGLDRLLGEPPTSVHPVARFGQAMGVLEQRMYADDPRRGALFCMVGVGGAAAVGWGLQRALGRTAATTLTVAVATAGRMLGREANAIGDLLVVGDLDGARRRLPALVGRSPDDLPASEVARAVVESVAENSVDAVVASVVWAGIGGAPLVLAHRAVNTLDAMVGHHSERYERFGRVSARLDDAANWVPARLAAVAVALASPRRAVEVVRVVRRDARRHPSPNGGVVEAAYAAALDVRLGGANRYGDVVEDRGVLGNGGPAAAGDVRRAVRLMDRTIALVGLAVALSEVGRWSGGRSRERARSSRTRPSTGARSG